MNKLIMTGCLVLAGLLLNAQSWNPYVNQGMFESTPLLPLEFEETGLVSFNFGNTGSSTIEHDKNNPDNNIKIVINLTNGVPDKNNPLAALKGAGKECLTGPMMKQQKHLQESKKQRFLGILREILMLGTKF